MAAGFLIYANRGAPAVDVAAYSNAAAETAQGRELSALNDLTGGVPGMDLVAETETLALYYHPDTTEVAVRDKRSDTVWYSNPPDRMEDGMASPFEKEVLSSQLTLTFRDGIGTLETYPNYTWSVMNGNYTAEGLDNGVRVTYTLGDVSLGIDALPKYISQDRLQEKVVSKLDVSLARYVQARYYPMKDNPAMLERLDDQIKKELVLKKCWARSSRPATPRRILPMITKRAGSRRKRLFEAAVQDSARIPAGRGFACRYDTA